MILFLVTDRSVDELSPDAHVLVMAADREAAKKDAQQWLKLDPDKYVITPLTAEGDQIRFNITMPRW